MAGLLTFAPLELIFYLSLTKEFVLRFFFPTIRALCYDVGDLPNIFLWKLSEMEISSELLRELKDLEKQRADSLDNAEYLFLKSKETKLRKLCFVTILFLLIISYLLVTGAIVLFFFENANENASVCFGLFFLYFLAVIVSIYQDSDYDKQAFDYFFPKTHLYSQIESYEIHFLEINKVLNSVKREIEDEAVSILGKIEIDAKKKLKEINEIYFNLKRKRKWESWYEKDLKTANKNYDLNRKNLEKINDYLQFIVFDKNCLKHFTALRDKIQLSYLTKSQIERKINSLYGKPSSLLKDQMNNRVTILNSSYPKPSTSDDNQPNLSNKTDINASKQKNRDIERLERKNNSSKESYQLNLFSKQPEINPKDLNDIPNQRKKIHYERIIKASPEFYKKIADKTIEIGLRGELLVLDFEKKRLIKEGDFSHIPIHIPTEKGDGLGYDILSFENGKEIHIEVKTTTGSFWSNLFFTQNEFEKMDYYNESYYLYRICNLDINTNKCELFIFKGKEFINSYFDFKSKVYVLTQKSQ